ncbi:hypothetical protein REPUB_Repub04eG0078300 [Reevesia pubescens]
MTSIDCIDDKCRLREACIQRRNDLEVKLRSHSFGVSGAETRAPTATFVDCIDNEYRLREACIQGRGRGSRGEAPPHYRECPRLR